MPDNDEKAKSLREFQTVFRNIMLEGFDKCSNVLMLGNSGGLALTIGIAGALVGGGSSPLPTLWPALLFCTGLLVSTAQPILSTWQIFRFRRMLETMMNPTADLTELEDSAKEEFKERLGYDGTPGFLVYRRLPSFIPVLLSSIFFVLGLISGMFGLYYWHTPTS